MCGLAVLKITAPHRQRPRNRKNACSYRRGNGMQLCRHFVLVSGVIALFPRQSKREIALLTWRRLDRSCASRKEIKLHVLTWRGSLLNWHHISRAYRSECRVADIHASACLKRALRSWPSNRLAQRSTSLSLMHDAGQVFAVTRSHCTIPRSRELWRKICLFKEAHLLLHRAWRENVLNKAE